MTDRLVAAETTAAARQAERDALSERVEFLETELRQRNASVADVQPSGGWQCKGRHLCKHSGEFLSCHLLA